jgi:hypothetical protein
VSSLDPVAIVEEAYDLGSSLDEWLERLAVSVAPQLDCGYGTQAVVYCPTGDPRRPIRIEGAGLFGTPPGMRTYLERMLSRIAPDQAREMIGRPARLWTYSELASPPYLDILSDGSRDLNGEPVRDTRVLLTTDGLEWLLFAGGFSPRWEATTPAQRRLWHRIATHANAAARLAWALHRGATPCQEAVLGPDGHLLHAEGDARARGAEPVRA